MSKEESVRFRRERQRVTHDERVIHAQLVDGAQTLLHAGERLRVDHARRRLLATVLRRVAVHERWAWIEQHHHGEGLFLLGEFHHAANHRLMALMHAIERTDGHHGFLIVAQRRPIHHAAGIRRERDCLHHVLLVYEFVSVV